MEKEPSEITETVSPSCIACFTDEPSGILVKPLTKLPTLNRALFNSYQFLEYRYINCLIWCMLTIIRYDK